MSGLLDVLFEARQESYAEGFKIGRAQAKAERLGWAVVAGFALGLLPWVAKAVMG